MPPVLSSSSLSDDLHLAGSDSKGLGCAGVNRLPATKQPSRHYVWYVVLILSVVNIFNYMDRMALAVLMPLVKADLQLSDGQLGLLVGLAFSIFYAICGLPIARWADRGNRRDIIAIALCTWSVMTVLTGVAQNFWQLFLTRVGVGAGEAGCLPPSQSMLCDYVQPHLRAGVFSIHNLGIYAGMMLGMLLAGWLGEVIGWRWTFAALGLPGIVFAFVLRITLREPTRGLFDEAESIGAQPSLTRTLGKLWRCRTFRLMTVFLVSNGFVQYGLGQWWPSFYMRIFGLSVTSAGVSLGVSIGVGSIAGLMVGGFVANRAARRDERLPLLIGAAALLAAIPTAGAAVLWESANHSLICVAATAFLWSTPTGTVVATVYSIVEPHIRATAGAITIFCTSVLGFGLGPFCVGLLSDLFVPHFGIEALRYALVLPVLLLPIMAISLYMASNSLKKDLRGEGHHHRQVAGDK